MNNPTPAAHAATAPAPQPTRRIVVLGGVMVAAAAAGELMRPSRRLAEVKAPIQLERQVPEAFGEWQIDRSIRPVLPDPSLQAMLDTLYSQLLARTYVNPRGQRVMLSIAYGSDQGNEATAVHRPEFCYSAQGFSVQGLGEHRLRFGGQDLRVRRVVSTLQARREPITYWVTLNNSAVLPGFSRKVEQIRLGLQGQIPDGMLVRVSSISNTDAPAFALQEQFLAALHDNLPPALRGRYFGSGTTAG